MMYATKVEYISAHIVKYYIKFSSQLLLIPEVYSDNGLILVPLDNAIPANTNTNPNAIAHANVNNGWIPTILSKIPYSVRILLQVLTGLLLLCGICTVLLYFPLHFGRFLATYAQ
jgi:hypothetical protein